MKVLNISYGSWGPDNCYAYLEKYGTFGAQKFLLLVSSHDAYDNMNFVPTVDVLPAYSSKQFPLAIMELVDRYLMPATNKKTETPERMLAINKKERNSVFNSGFGNFLSFCRSHNIPLLVYLHAEKEERIAGKYNAQGVEIINFCKQHNLPIIKELDYEMPASAYRDVIHPNDAGQDYIFRILKDTIL
ncbi:hypothetical protein SAMN05444008_111178 [Cnuella takakiae]|uniref:Lysophospholipase L1 n=1 Tax=Cnuella takakiae TaxID=1302690 RepID=A0A1M5E286_9BACT|nr:hypothetical protein [Cnuella takakiae]SHF73378.1 hypothetical protein SAMN05444008_111178 [Cnuella takakiae]